MKTFEINPISFCKYLEKTNWKEFKTKRTDVKYYQITKKGKDYQANIPLDKKLGDYEFALGQSVQLVTLVNEISSEELIDIISKK